MDFTVNVSELVYLHFVKSKVLEGSVPEIAALKLPIIARSEDELGTKPDRILPYFHPFVPKQSFTLDDLQRAALYTLGN